MKYLVLLVLLVGCSQGPLYKAGDCLRLYGNISVGDFLVREVFKDRYILSPAFKHNDVPFYNTKKFSFSYDELSEKSKQISCSDVE